MQPNRAPLQLQRGTFPCRDFDFTEFHKALSNRASSAEKILNLKTGSLTDFFIFMCVPWERIFSVYNVINISDNRGKGALILSMELKNYEQTIT